MLFLDGAYVVNTAPAVFRCVAPPSERELEALVQRIAERIGRALERAGLLERDVEQSYVALEADTRVRTFGACSGSPPHGLDVGGKARGYVRILPSIRSS